MDTLKIAGVPEHFNLPWKLALENQEFADVGIDLYWTDVPEGTGKLCQMLRDAETDVAVILTEGIIKDILNGNPSKIVQVYVESPLIWGIHVDANSQFQTIEDLKEAKVAISRPGSGSQLMAFVNAANQNWKTDTLQFETVHTIDGAVTALSNGTADYFMWERFMTKPLVDSGVFRRLGDCLTPWPSFVIAVRNEILLQKPDLIRQMLDIINKKTSSFKEIPEISNEIAARFGQKPSDVTEWLSLTEWSQQIPDEALLNIIQNQLLQLKVIDKKGTFAEIVHS
ncbi:MAG: ABC transporter substrate-binding protein [Flavobacterium sp.]|nr:ABC transporter substrate-binding protein [Flavobacterium sp.]